MNPIMPTALKPVVDGYSLDDPGGVMRTEVAGGAHRFALDWDRGAQRFQITLILDAMQFSVWTAFYAHVIKKGAITFDMPMDSGFGMQMHSVNIMPGSYSASRTSGVMMVVSFVAEAENKVYDMTAEDGVNLIAFYELYGSGSTQVLDAIARFATVDSLVLNF